MSNAEEPARGHAALPAGLRGSLALVRHAESTWVAEGRFQGRLDPPLSERGRRQAALLAKRLSGRERNLFLPLPAGDPVAIWHSPLARARDTAAPIAERLPRVPLVPTDAFTEIGQGDWEGRLHADVLAADGELLARWRHSPTVANAPRGERLLEAAARVRRGLAEVTAALVDGPGGGDGAEGARPWGIVLAHDGVLRLALLGLLGIPYERFWSFPFALGAISVLELADGRASLRGHGLVDHLARLAGDPAGAGIESERPGAL